MIHSLKIPPKFMKIFEKILLERTDVVSFQHSTFCKSCLWISVLSFCAHWMIKWDWNNLSVFFYDLKSWKIHWSHTWKRVIFWPTLDFLTRSFILIATWWICYKILWYLLMYLEVSIVLCLLHSLLYFLVGSI